MNSQQIIETTLELGWEKYLKNFVDLIRKHNEFINVNISLLKKYNKKRSGELIKMLEEKIKNLEETINPDLDIFERKFQKQVPSKRIEILLSEVRKQKEVAANYIVKLNGFLIMQYQFECASIKGNYKRAELLRMSFNRAKVSNELLLNHPNLLPCGSRDLLIISMIGFATDHDSLSPEKIEFDAGPIYNFIAVAKKSTYADGLKCLQSAYELAKKEENYALQFYILIEENYLHLREYQHYLTKNHLETLAHYTSLIYDPLLKASTLMMEDKLPEYFKVRCRGIVDTFYEAASRLTKLSDIVIMDKLQLAIGLNRAALAWRIRGDDLSMKLDGVLSSKNILLTQIVNKKLMMLQGQKAVLEQKKMIQESEELLLEKQKNEYDKQFSQILKKFDDCQQKKQLPSKLASKNKIAEKAIEHSVVMRKRSVSQASFFKKHDKKDVVEVAGRERSVSMNSSFSPTPFQKKERKVNGMYVYPRVSEVEVLREEYVSKVATVGRK
jgi:hypothetical protein